MNLKKIQDVIVGESLVSPRVGQRVKVVCVDHIVNDMPCRDYTVSALLGPDEITLPLHEFWTETNRVELAALTRLPDGGASLTWFDVAWSGKDEALRKEFNAGKNRRDRIPGGIGGMILYVHRPEMNQSARQRATVRIMGMTTGEAKRDGVVWGIVETGIRNYGGLNLGSDELDVMPFPHAENPELMICLSVEQIREAIRWGKAYGDSGVYSAPHPEAFKRNVTRGRPVAATLSDMRVSVRVPTTLPTGMRGFITNNNKNNGSK